MRAPSSLCSNAASPPRRVRASATSSAAWASIGWIGWNSSTRKLVRPAAPWVRPALAEGTRQEGDRDLDLFRARAFQQIGEELDLGKTTSRGRNAARGLDQLLEQHETRVPALEDHIAARIASLEPIDRVERLPFGSRPALQGASSFRTFERIASSWLSTRRFSNSRPRSQATR